MASTIYLGLFIICLSRSIEIARAGWDYPPFSEPVPKDKALYYFKYDPDTTRANIILDEEVDYAVCIAMLNYKDDAIPLVGPMNDGKSNFVLGAELRRDESTRSWALWITKKQDYETPIMQQYRFPIILDSLRYTIALNIRNLDDNPPVIQALERNCTIEENYVGQSKCNYVVSDADGWIDQVKIYLTSIPIGENFQFVTSAVSGSQYNINGFLNVTKSLDFETISMFMLLIRAVDGAKNESNLTTMVQVIDMPDQPPAWTRLTAAENILEKSTNTFGVSAMDGDVQINATINYRIIVNDEKDEKYFEVDQQTGLITINEIDRDARQQDIFRFVIIAYEVPEPESSINATIIVIVEDINDHTPEITPKVLEIEIEEEKYTTLEFDPSIEIKDPDLAENAQFSVSLTDDSVHNWSSAFLVVPTTGYQSGYFTISVINASLLDYENKDWRVINIQLRAIEVSNTSHVGTRNIRINLKNWNDELPIFDENTLSSVSIPEDVKKFHPIATVHATDRDVDDNVTHSLVAQQSLTIDEKTGEIVTNKADALDYESMPIVVIQIVATDLANHKTYATLTINVVDVNDVPPKLELPKTSPKLEEEVAKETEVVASISANDVDTDADLKFSIDWDNTIAHKSSVPVDESLYRGHLDIRTEWPKSEQEHRYAEGKLFVTGRIDYEAFDVMFITISVTDRKTVHNDNTTSASLTLNIEDINDNSPIFARIDVMNVTENQIKDALIGTVVAKDADGPKFNRVSYYIEPINGTNEKLVVIDNATGVIRVDTDKGIDAEEYEYIYYKVIATDGTNNSTENLEIYVFDQNDEEPYLINENFNSTILIREKSPNGTRIVQIQGDDDDRTYPFNNVSYLINGDYAAASQYFSMGRFDGWIIVNLTDGYILDRDFGSATYTLNLKLRDNYLIDYVTSGTNAIDTVVTVILEDINDQKPELPNLDEPAISVSENAKKNDLILTVVANDRDDPKTDNTKVFYEIKSVLPAARENEKLDENCKILFNVKTRDQSAADIFANCDLKGYYGRWIIELYAQDLGTDPGPCNDTRNYVVQVKDFNYNKPEILFPTSKKIPLRKEQTLHAQLRTFDNQLLSNFKATDVDHGDSGIVNFSLNSETGNHEYFEIISISTNVAQLRLKKEVNIETQYSYTMTLIATDGGDPPMEATQEFTVVFVTQSGPTFMEKEWNVWFKENKTGLDDWAIIPEARDMVGEAGENTVDIYYFLKADDEDTKYFALDKVTRNLTLTDELDREKQDKMILHVIAATDKTGPPTNPLKDAVLKIIVIVLDENDNPPIFESITYRGGVAMEDALDKVILTVKATDADINETLSYRTISNSITTSDSSLEAINNPFSIDEVNGDLLLKFTVISSMKGYFKFNIIVHDKVNHTDTAEVQIYIIPQSNRVVFTFNNVASYVKEERMFVIKSFTESFGYLCNVDDIKSTVGRNYEVLDNTTTLTTHFISPTDNLPINADTIILASSDLTTITNLKAALLERSLRLVDVPTGSSTTTNDIQQTVHWILVTLTTFFCLCSLSLLVAYIIRTRRLNQRLEKLAITKYGSQESGLDRAGAVPTTNQFAIAGSNPMWNTTERNIDDNVSQVSGDSDLIGIENNPDFGYVNNAMIANERWENSNEGSVNPIFANPKVTSGGLFDRTDRSQENEK